MTTYYTQGIFKCFITCLMLLYCQLSFAQDNRLNGGLLIYSIEKGVRWVLLADYKKDKKKWAGFGGKFDSKWDKTALDTAIRETSEETFCFYTEAALLIHSPQTPILDQRYITYLAEVPFIPAKKIDKRKSRKSFCKKNSRTKERKRFRWVKWLELKQDLIRLEQQEKLPFDSEQSSKVLNASLSQLPGKDNFYHHAYATSLYEFLKAIRKGFYSGW